MLHAHYCSLIHSAKFAINTNTGVVTVLGDLDAENRSLYSIQVRAREDLGVPASTPDVVSVLLRALVEILNR